LISPNSLLSFSITIMEFLLEEIMDGRVLRR